MMNSTDFSVRRNKPVVALRRSRGMTMWIPLLVSTFSPPVPPARSWVCSVHTPVALMIRSASMVNSLPFSRSTALTPQARPRPSLRTSVTLTRLAAAAPYLTAVRISVITRRASSTRAS